MKLKKHLKYEVFKFLTINLRKSVESNVHNRDFSNIVRNFTLFKVDSEYTLRFEVNNNKQYIYVLKNFLTKNRVQISNLKILINIEEFDSVLSEIISLLDLTRIQQTEIELNRSTSGVQSILIISQHLLKKLININSISLKVFHPTQSIFDQSIGEVKSVKNLKKICLYFSGKSLKNPFILMTKDYFMNFQNLIEFQIEIENIGSAQIEPLNISDFFKSLSVSKKLKILRVNIQSLKTKIPSISIISELGSLEIVNFNFSKSSFINNFDFTIDFPVNFVNLKELGLNFCDTQIEKKKFGNYMVNLLQNNNNLRSLSLNVQNSIDIEDLKELGKLPNNISLKFLSLNLSDSKFNPKAYIEIGKFINNFSDLRVLLLSFERSSIDNTSITNLFSDKSTQSIERIFLNLKSNFIKNEGCLIITKYLKSLKNISHLELDLERNSITSDGAIYFCDNFLIQTRLSKLKVNLLSNVIGFDTQQKLKQLFCNDIII